jgi:hypothetical protein
LPRGWWYRTVPQHRRRWPTVVSAAAVALSVLLALVCVVGWWRIGPQWAVPLGLVLAWGGDAWARRMPWAPPTVITAADIPSLPPALLVYARQPAGLPPTPMLPDRRLPVPTAIRGGGTYRAIPSQWPPPLYRP